MCAFSTLILLVGSSDL